MQGSYRTARIAETRNLFLGRLRHCVWAVEQEHRNLLVGLLADIYSPMNTVAWLLPVNLSPRNLDAMALFSIPVPGRFLTDFCCIFRCIFRPAHARLQQLTAVRRAANR